MFAESAMTKAWKALESSLIADKVRDGDWRLLAGLVSPALTHNNETWQLNAAWIPSSARWLQATTFAQRGFAGKVTLPPLRSNFQHWRSAPSSTGHVKGDPRQEIYGLNLDSRDWRKWRGRNPWV